MHYDCKFFLGDRPCDFHKQYGVMCNCEHYKKIGTKILIVKVGNMGDVVRTTSILTAIKRKYPESFICWLTRPQSIPLLEGINLIDRIYAYQWPDIEQLKVEHFDLVYCLDKESDVAAISDQIKANKKMGSTINSVLGVTGHFPEAKHLFDTGLDDNLKKSNTKSQQQLYCEAVGLEWKNDEYMVSVPNVQPFKEVDVCLNYLFDDDSFRTRGWFYWDELELLLKQKGISYTRQKLFPDLKEYIDWINSGRVVVSTDSLGLHLAIGLKKKVVAIFSSTGYPEISLYNRGVKLLAKELDCILCRKHSCNDMTCMRLIKPEMVLAEIEKLL